VQTEAQLIVERELQLSMSIAIIFFLVLNYVALLYLNVGFNYDVIYYIEG
jgi:hypothetical protein